MPSNSSQELLPGTKFNRLMIVRLDHKDKRWRRHYLCKCDCGKEKVVQGSLLISGNTKSCGCLAREVKAAAVLPGGLGAMRQVITQNYIRAGKRRKWDLTEIEFFELSQRHRAKF